MHDATETKEEVFRRARSHARRETPASCVAKQDRVRFYRGLVANVNAATDTEMDLALLAR